MTAPFVFTAAQERKHTLEYGHGRMPALRVVRDVTVDECPWFRDSFGERDDDVFYEGDIVYRFDGHTYGCISPTGIACSRVQGEHPFIEIPADALEFVD